MNYWNEYNEFYFLDFYQENKLIIQKYGVDKYSKPLDKILDMLNSTNDMIMLIYSLKYVIKEKYLQIFNHNLTICFKTDLLIHWYT